MLQFLNTLDRRWVFLAMGLAVAIPILLGIGATEQPTAQTQRMFDYIESLPEGSRVLMALDYDPSSEAELTPMAYSFTRHCCLRRHKLYFLTLWPSGPPMLDKTIAKVVQAEFSSGGQSMTYGEDYLNLGYFPGEFGAVNPICSNLRQSKSQDSKGISLDALPMMNGITGAKDMQLIVNVSGGYPGAKEWVQYGSTPHNIPIGAGCTGVQATQLFPYHPDQLVGLVAAIRGAAEYEAILAKAYPQYTELRWRDGTRRMGAQQWAHRLMIGLILLGNAIHFASRRGRGQR